MSIPRFSKLFVLPGLFACFVFAAAFSSLAGPHKIRVGDANLARSLQEEGARLIADYGSFQLLEVDGAKELPLQAGAQAVDEFDLIQLNARRLNTRTPEVQAARKAVAVFAGKRLHLVHFAGPIKPDWTQELEQTGVKIISYIPHNSYLIYGDIAALNRMQTWSVNTKHVQWEGDYADEYKIHPKARSVDEKGNPRNPAPDLFAVQLVDDAIANPGTLALIDQMKLAPVQNQFRTLHYLNVIARLPAGRLNEIAARPEVVSIQPYVQPKKRDERQNQILAGNLTGTGPTGPGYLQWLAGKGFSQAQFTSSGFAVDVSDSGIDNGTTAPGHFGLYRSGDPAQPSRVIYNRLEGSSHGNSTLQGCDGHGTLNSHIIAGYNDLPNGFPHTDSAGYHYGLGVCPFVKIGSSVIFDPDTFTNPNYANLQSDAYQDGARISANSWGADVAGAYNIDSQSYDALVRDAQPAGSTFATAGNQQMVIVFASGNAGPGTQTVGSPGTGKNVITVGASENVRSMSTANGGNNTAGNDGCNTPDTDADSANDMSDFSSRGPCSDGRQKPDIVAPGTHITGGVGQAGLPTISGTGTAISCFDGTGVCRLPGGGTTGDPDNFFPLSQQFYTESSGTSHSTPAVAGACALLRQFFVNNGLTPPSPALTKAFLINSSRYLNGVFANDSLWSPNQGMGEMNLGVAFDGVPRALHDQLSGEKFTASGQTRTITGTISDSTKPFRVTLAWTDAPGSTTGNAFNNDLDLTVTVGGNTYKGNVFNGAFSATGGTADNKNNVESVFLPPGLTGNFIVTVTAANINSDGVPNEAPSLDQDFALIVYNAAEGFVPILHLDSTVVTAESCSPGNGAIDPGETVTVAFVIKNTGGVGTTNLTVTLLATNGVAAPSGSQFCGVIAGNGGTVTQSFSFTASGPCGGTIQPILQFQDGPADLGSASTTLDLGTRILTVKNVTNASVINVPGSGKSGPGSPYPSTITVSGVTGIVSKITVTLVGVGHTFPDDMDVLLAGPTGQTVLLMSDCGGGTAVSGLTLTFDDNAASALGDSSAITSGTYKPSDYETTSDTFNSPAPTGPYGQSLTAFNGLNPNGTWSLFTQDDSVRDSGSIAQGWRISITTSSNVCCGFTPPNLGPTLAAISNRTIAELSTLTFTNSATDPDVPPQILTYSLSNAPAGAAINSTNGVFIWTPGEAQGPGIYSITVVVTDNGSPQLSDSKTFSVTVNEVNSAPTLAPIANQTIVEGSTLILTNVASDPDLPPQTLTFSFASTAPAGANVDSATGVFSWTPSESQGPGAYTIRVRVTDNGSPALSATNTFTVTVTELNSAPVLSAVADRTISEGATLTFTNAATDSDLPANTLAYSLETNAPPGATINSTTGVFTWAPTEAQGPSTNSITVRVTDNGSPALNDTKTFTVAVTEINSSPSLASIADQILYAGTTLVLTNVASDSDIPTNSLTFSLGTNAPAGAFIDATNGIFTWTPTEEQIGTNSLTVTVTDGGSPSLSDNKTFSVSVLSRPLLSIENTGTNLTLSWIAIAGKTYRVQFKTNLNGSTWTNLSDIIPSSSPAILNDSFSETEKYYRLLLP